MTTSEALTSLLRAKLPVLDTNRPLPDQFSSLELFAVVNEVEKAFNVRFLSIELNEENLRSIRTWTELIEKARLRQ